MKIFIILVAVIGGLVSILNPEGMLRFGDIFRVKGDREYTDYAKTMTVIGGVFALIFAVVYFISILNGTV